MTIIIFSALGLSLGWAVYKLCDFLDERLQ